MSERTSIFVPWFMHDTRHAGEKSKMKAYVTSSLNIEHMIVLLLGIFRRAPCPSATRGTLVSFYFPGGALPLNNFI
jgi:hypothetical protein